MALLTHPVRTSALAVCIAAGLCAWGWQSASAAKRTTALRVIVQDDQGAPISRASVVVTRMKGKKLKGRALQLKTSNNGSAPLPPIDQGTYMLQVINTGFQTYGGKLELTEPEQTYTVTLKPPQKQYSVHTAKKE